MRSANVSSYSDDFPCQAPAEWAQAGLAQTTSEWDPGRAGPRRPRAVWWRGSCPSAQRPLEAGAFFPRETDFFGKYGTPGTHVIWISFPVSYPLGIFCSFTIRDLVDGTSKVNYSLWQVVCNFFPRFYINLKWDPPFWKGAHRLPYATSVRS